MACTSARSLSGRAVAKSKMKNKDKYLRIAAALIVVASMINGPTLNILVYNQEYLAHFRSTPLLILTYPILVFFLIKILRKELVLENMTSEYCGIGRQYIALVINMIVYILIPFGPVSLVFLFFEYRVTGRWQWEIFRDHPMPYDHYIVYVTGVSMIILLALMALPIRYRRQSPGEYILGMATNGQEVGILDAIFRIFAGALTLCIWPISVYMAYKDKRKQFWHQKIYKSTVVNYSERHAD